MNIREKLAQAIAFAASTGSFNPINVCKNTKNVCIFGLGRFFEEAFDTWNMKKLLNINVLCDNNPEKWGKTFKGLPCIPPEDLVKFEDLIVIPLVGDREPVFKQIHDLNIRCLDPQVCLNESFSKSLKSSEWFSGNKILEVYDMLVDEESKRIYASVVINRIAFWQYPYSSLYTEGQYFPDFLELRDDEVFVDCGAYTGDTMLQFLNAAPRPHKSSAKFKEIYAFEVDTKNFKELKKTADSIRDNDPNATIHCHHAGVWDETDMLSFGREEHGSFEYVSALKTDNSFLLETVPVVKIDDFCKNATFIKMDIEGAELNALKGAENTIKSNAPKLAISIYHQLNDFWEIPVYLKTIVPEYNFYVRHHSNGLAETVLYADK